MTALAYNFSGCSSQYRRRKLFCAETPKSGGVRRLYDSTLRRPPAVVPVSALLAELCQALRRGAVLLPQVLAPILPIPARGPLRPDAQPSAESPDAIGWITKYDHAFSVEAEGHALANLLAH